MFELTLKTAKVVSIEDLDRQGKIQIQIESEFEGIPKNLLPWAIPLISNVSDSTMEMHLPKENSQVWVLVDKYYKRFYYISNRYFYSMFNFTKVNGLLAKCNKINTEYKNLDFKYYLDGTLIFHNNSDGSSGIITSQGTLIYIDSQGDLIKEIEKDENTSIKGNKSETILGKHNLTVTNESQTTYKNKQIINCQNDMEYTAMGNITLKSKANGLVELGNTVSSLGKILTEICQDLASLTTVGSPATHTSPILSGQMASLIPKIKMVFK